MMRKKTKKRTIKITIEYYWFEGKKYRIDNRKKVYFDLLSCLHCRMMMHAREVTIPALKCCPHWRRTHYLYDLTPENVLAKCDQFRLDQEHFRVVGKNGEKFDYDAYIEEIKATKENLNKIANNSIQCIEFKSLSEFSGKMVELINNNKPYKLEEKNNEE